MNVTKCIITIICACLTKKKIIQGRLMKRLFFYKSLQLLKGVVNIHTVHFEKEHKHLFNLKANKWNFIDVNYKLRLLPRISARPSNSFRAQPKHANFHVIKTKLKLARVNFCRIFLISSPDSSCQTIHILLALISIPTFQRLSMENTQLTFLHIFAW